MSALTAASVPGGDSSDVPEDGYGAPRRDRLRPDRLRPGREKAPDQAWPDFLSPDHVPPGHRPSGEDGAVGPSVDAQGSPEAAAAAWPVAAEGAETTAPQVFRPETGRPPAPDEAETDAAVAEPDRVAAAPSVPPVPPAPPVPPEPVTPPVRSAPPRAAAQERARPAAHGWDDGLIARRAPAAPAEPVSRTTTGRVTPVHGGWEDNGVPENASHGRDGSAAVDRAEGHDAFPQEELPHDTGPYPARALGDARPPEAGPAEPAGAPPARAGGGAVRPSGGGGLPSAHGVGAGPVGGTLRRRLGALRELIGLSRTRLEGRVLAEAGRVLDEAGARAQLSAAYTTVAIAGATGSGKSSLLNALAGRTLSETGLRRPTTAQPVACTWEAEREGGADGLLDRLGIAPTMRRRVKDAGLHGLVLIDLPDHDSVATGHREHVDRLLELVDAVVWVVDPEKYADAMLHERYLRPLAGYAEVTFVVLNQIDRLPGEATDAVLHDLRRLLDEDGMALGDYGEPGARVLATSALTGEGMQELREELGAFAATREAPARRLTADLDGAAERLRQVYADPALPVPGGLTDADREEFEDLLASAVGACAAGQAAERAWLRHAERSCGTPWSQLVRWRDARRRHRRAEPGAVADTGMLAAPEEGRGPARVPGRLTGRGGLSVARPVLAQAVRQVADRAAVGLPDAWRKTVRDAAWRGAEGLPEALDALVEEAVADGAYGGAEGEATSSPALGPGGRADGDHVPARMPRPPWWTVAMLAQGLLLALQVVGVFLLAGAAFGTYQGGVWPPVLLVIGCAVGSPALAAGCRAAARGPARAFGQEEERRLRRLSAGCGRTRVLEPVAAELLRYREVREQYVVASGDADRT